MDEGIEQHFGAVEAFFVHNVKPAELPSRYSARAMTVFAVTVLHGVEKTQFYRNYGRALAMLGIYPAVPIEGIFPTDAQPTWWRKLNAEALVTVSGKMGLHQRQPSGLVTLNPNAKIATFLQDSDYRNRASHLFEYASKRIIEQCTYNPNIRPPWL